MTTALIGMILMTVGVLQFTIVPPIADLNRSHAANPTWPGHARFHLVTQVLTTSGLGMMALYFLWSGHFPRDLGICFATCVSAVALGSFFLSAAGSQFYGGQLAADRGLGALRVGIVDPNVINFGSAATLIFVGRFLV